MILSTVLYVVGAVLLSESSILCLKGVGVGLQFSGIYGLILLEVDKK